MCWCVSSFMWGKSTALFSEPIDRLWKTGGFLKNTEYSSMQLHGKIIISCRSRNRNRNLGMLKNLQTTTFVIRHSNNNVNPAPSSGSPSSGSLRNWIVGIVLTFILPFVTHKWGSFLLLKSKVDQKLEKTEHIVRTIENVADKVDHVIDSITDDLPRDSKLKKTLEYVDEIAEGVAKTAHVADDIINKVEEAEDKLESLIHDENSKEGVIPHEDKDKEDQKVTDQLESGNNINKTH